MIKCGTHTCPTIPNTVQYITTNLRKTMLPWKKSWAKDHRMKLHQRKKPWATDPRRTLHQWTKCRTTNAGMPMPGNTNPRKTLPGWDKIINLRGTMSRWTKFRVTNPRNYIPLNDNDSTWIIPSKKAPTWHAILQYNAANFPELKKKIQLFKL